MEQKLSCTSFKDFNYEFVLKNLALFKVYVFNSIFSGYTHPYQFELENFEPVDTNLRPSFHSDDAAEIDAAVSSSLNIEYISLLIIFVLVHFLHALHTYFLLL